MRASETERFRELAATSLPWMSRTATALAGDPHRADDLVQEALVKVYVNWRKVRSADDPRAYLRRILVRCHLDAARAPRRREVTVGAAGDVMLDRADPHDRHELSDTRSDLAGALSQLTAKQRAVVVLRFLEDVDVAGTAEALGISDGTVKSTTYDALRLLRGHLVDSSDDTAHRAGGRR